MSGLLTSLPGALAALAVVLALIVLSGRAARLIRAGRLPAAGERRLAIRAAMALDPRRRVVLITCDKYEILLLTGGPQDLVIGWLPQAGDVA
jgi:flagellar protein FliO/FliZ